MNNVRIAFFGTPDIAVFVLEELSARGIVPELIITNPDTPQGRKLIVTPTPVALWGERHGIRVEKPETLRDASIYNMLKEASCNLFIVAAYGKIIPREILDIPHHKVLNIHPSLLPKLRGASPIRSAILEDMNPTGVSIMLLTEGLDEGPILAHVTVPIEESSWPPRGSELDELLARRGGTLLAETVPQWIAGEITPTEQDHAQATYSKKITKEMGLIDLTDDPYKNLLKIRAFDGWPGTYFFHERDGKKIRIKIIDAHIDNGQLVITRIVPEGKKEMDWNEYFTS